MKCSVQPRPRINEKHGVIDVVFLGQFGKGDRCNNFVLRQKKPEMEEFVGLRIGSRIQSVALIIEVNHGFLKRDVTRFTSTCRL